MIPFLILMVTHKQHLLLELDGFMENNFMTGIEFNQKIGIMKYQSITEKPYS